MPNIKTLNDILSQNVHTLRKNNKLSQEKAAELCGISSKYWGKVERGEVNATVGTVSKIAAGFETKPSALLEDGGVQEIGMSIDAGNT